VKRSKTLLAVTVVSLFPAFVGCAVEPEDNLTMTCPWFANLLPCEQTTVIEDMMKEHGITPWCDHWTVEQVRSDVEESCNPPNASTAQRNTGAENPPLVVGGVRWDELDRTANADLIYACKSFAPQIVETTDLDELCSYTFIQMDYETCREVAAVVQNGLMPCLNPYAHAP